jgi:hypothetical protein
VRHRNGELIADVQVNMPPKDRLPDSDRARWPGIESLRADVEIEQIEPDKEANELASPNLTESTAYAHLEATRLGPQVGFPEHENGYEALADAPSLAGVDSVDALAFYLPFHFYRKWGIYIREAGLLSLASGLFTDVWHRLRVVITPDEALDYSYRILFAHEFFHHQVEIACARLQYPLPPSQWAYPHFFNDRNAGEKEEAHANAFALRTARLKYDSEVVAALNLATRAWMRGLGPGYRDFRDVEGRLRASKDVLVQAMGHAGGSRLSPSLTPGHVLFHDIPSTLIPTYLIADFGGCIGVIRNFPSFGPLGVWAYTNDHKPPHVHTGTGPGNPQSLRFEWPSRQNMDQAPVKVEKQFNTYADRYSADINKKVRRINWK